MSQPSRSIVVATDLQSSSRPIVELAGKLARAADARLDLLHVIEPGSVEHVPRSEREAALERRKADCKQALDTQAGELEQLGVRVHPTYVADRPAHEAILERVEDTGADLVVVGSTAREGHGHRLGSTADRVLRTSPAPCLIVRGEVELPIERAAAATDFSDHSREAVRAAAPWLEILGDGGARLDLLHAADRTYLKTDDYLEGYLEKQLSGEVELLADESGAARVDSRICADKHPVDALLKAVEDEGYQLLITGTHGHGKLRRALIGSVAMGLAQSAPCPVLVVPPPAGD